jgi:subtilisin family serine protease
LKTCHFREIWETLDIGDDPGPIGIIDQGGDSGHPELEGRIIKYVKPQIGEPIDSPHAGAVAAIISAIRSNEEGERMQGCCSADLYLYNVWAADTRFDYCAYYHALLSAACHQLPVLNLSMGFPSDDPTEKSHIRACLSSSVVVIAAMGSLESETPIYPAAYDGVIAIGATTESDQPAGSSCRGKHMWISAPGEEILTIRGDDDYQLPSGTSYAAPIVSAAVWLALRKKPGLSVEEIRCLLKHSVEPSTIPTGGHSKDLGHGRLDMLRLAVELENLRDCPQDS